MTRKTSKQHAPPSAEQLNTPANAAGESAEQAKRTAKALAGLAAGSIALSRISDSTWIATNGDGVQYTIVKGEAGWACTCPDWLHFGRDNDVRCKHIEAARLAVLPAPLSPSATSLDDAAAPARLPQPVPSAPPAHPSQPLQTTQTIAQGDLSPLDDILNKMAAALAEPFPAAVINWKLQAISNDKTRALAVAYIDARDVMARLDEVVGLFNWQVRHEQHGEQIMTGLGIKHPVTTEWIWKYDVGFVGGSASKDDDEQMKAIKGTASDGLKRAGVVWGIGRYLYSLPKVWVEFDPEKKVLKTTPVLPSWALPDSERGGKSARTQPSLNGKNKPGSDGRDNAPALPASQPPSPAPSPADIAKAKAMVMTLGSAAVKGKPLGELSPDVWMFLANSRFVKGEALALKSAAQLLLAST